MRKILILLFAITFMISCEESDNDTSGNSTPVTTSEGNSAAEFTSADCESRNSTLLNLVDSETNRLLTLNNDQLTQQVLAEVNAYRKSINLSELISNDDLLLLGIQHNEYQISQGKISHDQAPDRFCSIFSKVFVKSFAENTASGFTTAESVVQGLLDSPGHKKNIVGDFNAMSTSVVINKDGVHFYTQIFIKL